MPPMLEGKTLDNPTLGETDRETRVKFLKAHAHAYGGLHVERYEAGQVADVSKVCADIAIKLGVAQMSNDEIDTDPSSIKRNGAPENKTRR